MTPIARLSLTFVSVALAGGCAGPDASGSGSRSPDPRNPTTNSIGPNAAEGAPARDMAGAGRGSATFKGK